MTAVDYVSKTDTIHIATAKQDGSEVVTPIWGVAVDSVPYIRSGYGEGSKWYQRLQRTGQLTLVNGRSRYPAKIENVADENVIRQVDAAYQAKYRGQGSSLRAMVTPDARRYTMRLIPQDE